jgi:hypothetical protein
MDDGRFQQLGLPGVRFSTGQSGFLAICPVEKIGLNRTGQAFVEIAYEVCI